ncbi:MAG: HAMP domain-containing sensor histidine kinase [Clostridia bacterium]|nr:HAMP domain-containing sensor histidine kinase [Clostridia bacterium]
MNTTKNDKRVAPARKLVFQLWALMMALVLLAVAFMWVAQVFLFDQSYIRAAAQDVKGKIDAIRPELAWADLAESPELLRFLSISVNSKTLLIDQDGDLIGAYSFGHPLDLGLDHSIDIYWCSVQDSDLYDHVLAHEDFFYAPSSGTSSSTVMIGIPVRYAGQDAYVVLNHSLSDVYSMLDVNRRQLTTLTLLLSAAASILATLLAKRFTRPIFTIKGAVDEMAKGNLAAKPGLSRKDELGQLSDSVEALGRELQRVDVLRKEVIANVSHELRSPLALIGGYAEMVRDITWNKEQKRNEDLNLIISESKRMTEMVNDIMDYSQLQAGYLSLKKDVYNLYEIVESEVAGCENAAKENGIRLRLTSSSTDIPVSLDALKISQVIRNLLYNAINHTRDGETVTVEVRDAADDVRVCVINPGEEIPPEERERIWERYQRSQHQGGRKQGTGIGLSIVATILKAHGMPYGVDCHDGLTVFWFACARSR